MKEYLADVINKIEEQPLSNASDTTQMIKKS